MPDANTIPAKYIFLDVVDFTQTRSVEAQSDIVHSLNEIVTSSVSENSIPDENRVFLPTGDGICVALLNIECLQNTEPVYDSHLRIALEILKRLDEYNTTIEDPQRQFTIRIGINENIDNVVMDINGNRNVAGDGINLAQRVMSLADGNQVLVSSLVFATLRVREKYMTSSFKAHPPTKIKHGMEISVYQFIAKDHVGLNIDTPERFKTAEKVEPRLPKLIAFYFAHAIKNEPFFLSKGDSDLAEYPGVILLYMLAKDSLEASESTAIDIAEPDAPSFGGSLEEQYDYFKSLKFWISSELKNKIIASDFSNTFGYFKTDRFGLSNHIFINSAGKEKLKKDWPTIWQDFALEAAGEE